jgi:hypothetical protein
MSDTGGRPRAEIDLHELEKLCGLYCTQPDLAGWFGVSLNTIEKRAGSDELYDYDGERLMFREIMDRGYAKHRVSLRRRQMEAADRGNTAMLIWLGKQVLGQRDNMDLQHTGSVEIGIAQRIRERRAKLMEEERKRMEEERAKETETNPSQSR